MSTFYWSEETVNYFIDLALNMPASELAYEVIKFIETDCQEEGDETLQDLYDDLMGEIIEGLMKVKLEITRQQQQN